MPDGRPDGLADDEWEAILAHRKATRPQRKGTARYTDPDTGAEFEVDLTADEAEKVIGRAASKLFGAEPKDGGGKGGDDGKKPTALKDYFGGGKKASGS